MIRYLIEIVYHYSTYLTSWSWRKLYGDRSKRGNMGTKNVKADNWDGKSRPSNKAYDEAWHRIFGSNPVAKEVRTPKFKSQVVKSKKIYDRKKPHED